MIELHPQVIEKHGKKEFVILPYEDFLKIQEELESYNDLRMLREAKEKEGNAPTISLKEAKKELNIE
ncbi:MAG: type II toxin-antitoxin system Phd/YefM family antitoxin [Deltaproteobacteria bacterium]|jgi:PHD/YefM family antitoxin component YafN of YafNO toxin-antitoxin module|nr:MAG: type II toxin-antitoxin system Phd/YefM family antitoxin [Deltaproteobacteria bacterium]